MAKRKPNYSKDLFNDFAYIANCCKDSIDYIKKGRIDLAVHEVDHLQLWFYTITHCAFQLHERKEV